MLETPSILHYSPRETDCSVASGSENVGVRTISREVASPPNLAEALTPQRLHAELLATSASGAWSYLFGAAHDATISPRHNTVRFGQADVEWLAVLRLLLRERGQKAWIYREGKARRFWVLETSAKWLVEHLAVSTQEERRAYARGYFDAEGGIPRDAAARFYIQFVQKDRADIANLKGILEDEGIACGKLHRPSRLADHLVWRFYVAAASQRDFVSRVGSWHPRKRSLLEARFEGFEQPG
jgi:LAGLIDADG-like domain